MDIQVSSNFERLLYELLGRDGVAVAETMLRFRSEGRFTLERDLLGLLDEQWSGASIDDAATTEIIAEQFAATGVLIDPHTAVGLGAAAACRADRTVPMITMSTAHPAKFPDAVEAATGIRPPLPDRLADLFDRPERYDTIASDYDTVRAAIESVIA
jgi:threonine synthase